MDSDDEIDHLMVEDAALYRRRTGNLPLKVKSDKIANTLSRFYNMLAYLGDKLDSDQVEDIRRRTHRNLSDHHVERLFSTMAGFYKGNLDLTGRHLPRYERLRIRFDEVMKDYNHAASHCQRTTERVEEQFEDNGEVFSYDVHKTTFDPPTLWDDLAKKWGLRSMMDFHKFELMIGDYLHSVGAPDPQPKFQQLLLLDLPAEILDYIMHLSSLEDLRTWSSVCKLLRDHALKYVYERHDYKLDSYALDYAALQTIPRGEGYQERVNEYMKDVALTQRNNLVHRMSRVLQRDDILSRIRTLTFVETWSSPDILARIGCPYPDYIAPIIPLLFDHLRSSSTTELIYMTRLLYRCVWEAIADSKTLRTARLTVVRSSDDVQWAIAPNLINLDLRMLQDADDDESHLWDLVALCPSLLFLYLSGVHKVGTPLPSAVFNPQPGNVMTHIRRLRLGDIWADSLEDLIVAIEAAGPVPLTHLSISTAQSHIKRDLALRLVRSFIRAPDLRVLAISNLQYAHPDLFALLAECAPSLQAIALEYYPSIWHSSGASSPWPCPLYEYAPHLVAFPHLEHLAMNVKVMDFPYTTYFFPRLEDGYEGAEEADSDARIQWASGSADPEEDPEEIDHCFDGPAKSVVRLFAAYNRTLQTVFFERIQFAGIFGGWAIDRDEGGKVTIRDRLTSTERERSHLSATALFAPNWAFSEREADDILGAGRSNR
ncbi:uncharacterized protein SCHCODRAFT_02640649 [Schizophyllum commune H4-8]|uniref:uncharacterized protein n=1 Tax=Schizophyllum commune (strain H4-8 / FGSC 9210) TaxID=578458 RepID=UPI002160F0FC|nr:uncharacterized protein SCHCODRAFT_02640649 [Schizophyllum commune H4-8]KAI5887066.1 hypothetical protein SCHCODRAFT_02640649 [Schizophyllum commune H4-8]